MRGEDFLADVFSLSKPITFQCTRCQRETGQLEIGSSLIFARYMQKDFVVVAPEIDWYRCPTCGPVSTPLIISPEMYETYEQEIAMCIEMRGRTFRGFREEFPCVPHLNALIKEGLKINF